MGWKRVLFSQSRRHASSENHALPLCTLCFPSYFIIFYVAFLFLYSYRDDRVVSWPVVLYLSIYLERLFQREHEARAHWHCVHFFVVFLFLCLFLLLIAFGWKAWLLKGGPAKLSQVKLWHYFEQGRLGKIPSAMVLLTFGLPLHVFVVCCWGGRVVPVRAWSKSSLPLASLLCMSFTISYLFHLGERVGWPLRGGPAKLSQLKLWHYFEQGRLGKVPSAMVSLLAFIYMCLSAVAGVEGLSI